MSIQFNVDLTKVGPHIEPTQSQAADKADAGKGFTQAVRRSLDHVNGLQEEADASITDLLTGRQEDINSVVASVAKADMSFKLLVGVRNKLIEAYKETMKMQG